MRDRWPKDANIYLWAQTKVTSKEKVKIPKWFFLILPIATVFEVVSGCEWGERTSNLLQTVQRSQWGAHAYSQPKIKEWRLMMVFEQFSLQRKILKGQEDVRNEETSICTASEKNNNNVKSRVVLFFLFITWKISLSTSWQGQITRCTVSGHIFKSRPSLFLLSLCSLCLSGKKETITPYIQISVHNNHASSIQE